MANVVLIGVCFAIGIYFRHKNIFPVNAPQILNRFVLYISLPALTVSQIYRLEIHGSEMILPISMAWFQFILSFLIFASCSRLFQWNNKLTGALILVAGLGNTSFVGLPLLEALMGPSALGLGVLIDQLGTFLTMSTLGVATAAVYSGRSISLKMLRDKVLFFPPFIALVLAFILRPFMLSPSILKPLDTLATTLIPIALISVGLQLYVRSSTLKKYWKELILGLSFKLFIFPLIFSVLCLGILKRADSMVLITLLEGAMAPMITAGIIVQEYDLDSELGHLLIGVGILLSLITVPAWYYILNPYFLNT